MAVSISTPQLLEELMKKEEVLIDFWAPWCGPCRMLMPVLDQIESERPQMTLAKVNVDEAREIAQAFQVRSIPTLVLMRHGEIVKTSTGAQSKAQLLEFLNA